MRPMVPLAGYFCEDQILVFLLRTIWDNGWLLVKAECNLSRNKS